MTPPLRRPPRAPFGRRVVWAPTGGESARFDRFSIEERGVPERTLMENAGRSAALLLEGLFPRGTVTALVGSGNNGGDALVLLRNLRAWGRRVRAVLVGTRPDDDPLLHGWDVPVEPWSARARAGGISAALADAGVLVDGLLGTGLGGPPREPYADAIRAMNAAPAPVLALDVPSGVVADDGTVPGEAVQAQATVAFGWPKLGTLLHPGRAHAGRLVAVEIGFPPPGPAEFGARLITPEWVAAHRPVRPPATHKNRVGSLLLLAGRPGMAGAAVLAARAALRSGVGLVRVASHAGNREILQTAVPEAIFVDRADPDPLAEAMAASRALAAGSGMGTDEEAARVLSRLVEEAGDRPLVLDADALNLVAAGRVTGLREAEGRSPVLATPHPGEMSRLVEKGVEEIVADPVGTVREAARELGVTVLLKGTPSAVSSPDGPVFLECVGSSDLAVGGMGDVLTGAAGGFLAQGTDPLEAGALALHHTGIAALLAAGGPAFVPSDAVERLPEALAYDAEPDLPPFVLFHQDEPR